MDAILTDSHLDSRIKICVSDGCDIPKLEYAGELWEGNATFVKQLATGHMTTAKTILRSSTTTIIVIQYEQN